MREAGRIDLGGDHYRVLGVREDATSREIRRAYRRLAHQHHPDRNAQPDGPERFRTLTEAYAVLNDPARRARYDHSIQPPTRLNPRGATLAVLPRRGVLELSEHEARLAAIVPLTLATTSGMTIVLPVGLADGDQITIAVPEGSAVLTIRVNAKQKT